MTASDLKRHKLIHTGEKRFVCNVCPSKFNNNSHLKRHILYKHSGSPERQFKCEQCGMAFVEKSTLRLHKRTHTKEKPFICDTCGKGFGWKHHLVYHETTHSKSKVIKKQAKKSKPKD